MTILGVSAFMLANAVASLPRRAAVGALMVAILLVVAFLSGRPKEVFLFSWIVALTYNRQYFIFVPLVGEQGSQGPYIIASDFFLCLLLTYWMYERIVLKVQRKPKSPRLWPWYLPFAAVCLLSAYQAQRVDWALFDMIRVVKVAIILHYTRYNFGKREWWIAAVALSTAMLVQASLGTIEVVTRRSGALGIFGLGGGDITVTERFEGEFSQELWYGSYRATATMSHPPNLASYFLLTVPLCLCLGLTAPRPTWRLAASAAGLIGLAGLAATQSRWPWALMAIDLVLLFPGLMLLGMLPVKRMIGIVSVCTLAGLLVLIPLREKIAQRLSADLRLSSQGRIEEVRALMGMFVEHPFLGVGLNNTRSEVLKYRPELRYSLDLDTELTHQLHLRAIVSPQNGFAHVLLELGVLGFLTYLYWITGVFWIGMRALAGTTAHRRAACFGMLLGVFGTFFHQVVDFSFWVDPLLYSFPLVVGLMNSASVVEPEEQRNTTKSNTRYQYANT